MLAAASKGKTKVNRHNNEKLPWAVFSLAEMGFRFFIRENSDI